MEFMKNEYIKVFRAFSDENRVRVLELLRGGEQCACVLLEDLQISQPTLSHHMKILRDSGIVKDRRAGKWTYYSFNEDGCEYAIGLLAKLTQSNRGQTDLIACLLQKLLLLRRCAKYIHLPQEKTQDIRTPISDSL
jgi:ArsR family transcriptional regulator